MAERVSDNYTLAAELERIDDARQWSRSRAQGAEIDEATIQDLELAMTEALSNTIRHGYGEDRSQRIELALEIDASAIKLSILDRGAPFDPADQQPVDFDSFGEGGYGLFLIEQLTDEVSRTPSDDGGTLVTLVKYRKEHS